MELHEFHVVGSIVGAPFFDAPHKPWLQQSEGNALNLSMRMFFLECGEKI
jgi:hypothetical protein